MNEHQVMQKSHDATQKKCPHVVHFNVPRDWFETNLLLRRQEKHSSVSRCTGKINFILVSRPVVTRQMICCTKIKQGNHAVFSFIGVRFQHIFKCRRQLIE